MARSPGREIVPPVQKLRMRYAKRGRLRFASHRDLARSFERALRRVGIPMAFSAGFNPHPKISYANAVPTGTASEAEYLEIGVLAHLDPDAVRDALNAVLPDGMTIEDVVVAQTSDLIARLEAGEWVIELPGVEPATAAAAVDLFLAQTQIEVERMTKGGLRRFDTRGAVVALAECSEAATDQPCAILRLVVRHGTPSVRPDDILAALKAVADLAPPFPPRITRLAQGPLDEDARTVQDPFLPDRGEPSLGA
jgi:hypothetical protein